MQIRRMLVQISLVFYFFFFISNLKDVGSNPLLDKTFITNKKKKPPFSLFTIISQKIINLYSFQKILSTKILPPHTPFSTLHMLMVNATTQKKRSPQAKTCWSIFTYQPMVYTVRCTVYKEERDAILIPCNYRESNKYGRLECFKQIQTCVLQSRCPGYYTEIQDSIQKN